MVIKAKYPKVGNELVGVQGYGSQGNNISDITRIDRVETLVTVNESIFPKDTVKEILKSLKNRATYYENHEESTRLIRSIENCF